VAPLAMCWSIDTIPKPDGLAGPVPGPESNRDATKAGRCPALFVMGSSAVRRRYRPADQRRASCWRIIESSTC
jgi:hypothetical protein